MIYRILYATGPGNVIEAHKYWSQNQHYPPEVSITFSSQLEDLCREIGGEAYIIGCPSTQAIYHDGPFTLEHRPKPMPHAKGLGYHVAELIYGFSLLLTAIRFRANVAVLVSGRTHYFVMGLFPLVGIKVVVHLQSTLWPAGYPPTRTLPRMIGKLDSLFFRWLPTGTICISPECSRQVEHLTKGKHTPLYQFRPQFRREHFQEIPPPPRDQDPFRIMYVGRIVRNKGVFDILEMAKRIEADAPKRVRWEICGTGSDLEELRRLRDAMNLEEIVTIRGWTPFHDLQQVYARSHASIVPSRSDYKEGLAMTAAEAILAGRPIITTPVVPALEVLRPACVEAKTDDLDSYVSEIMKLIDDPNKYYALCKGCQPLQNQFYDRSQGFGEVLKKLLKL